MKFFIGQDEESFYLTSEAVKSYQIAKELQALLETVDSELLLSLQNLNDFARMDAQKSGWKSWNLKVTESLDKILEKLTGKR